MPWLIAFLGGLLTSIFDWFVKRGVLAVTLTTTYIATFIGLYLIFIIGTTAAFFALQPITPKGVSFALSFIPPVGYAMFNLFFTAQIAKAVYEFRKEALKELHASMNRMNY
jgi:hypothetical protein